MHDEAVTHYVDQVDQMTLGHSFLLDTFGVSPDVGWQVIPVWGVFHSYFFFSLHEQDLQH